MRIRLLFLLTLVAACTPQSPVADAAMTPADAGVDAGSPLSVDAGAPTDAGVFDGGGAITDGGVDGGAAPFDAGNPVVCAEPCDPTGRWMLSVSEQSCLDRSHVLTIKPSATVDGGFEASGSVSTICGSGAFSVRVNTDCAMVVTGVATCIAGPYSEANGFDYSAEFSACGTEAVVRFRRSWCEGDPNGSWRTYRATLRRQP